MDQAQITKMVAAVGGGLLLVMQTYTASQVPGIEHGQDEIKQELLVDIQSKHYEVLEKILEVDGANQREMIKYLDEIDKTLKEQTKGN